MAALTELVIGSDSAPWAAAGLAIDGDQARVGAVTLRFAPGQEGIARWGISGLDAPDAEARSIDGLPSYAAPSPESAAPANPMGAIRLELVSIFTTSIERTASAITAATGEPLRRLRELGSYRVGFIRLGEALAEIGQSERATGTTAVFGGMIIVVADLEELCARLGLDVISEPRIAVQYGRRIATFRKTLGLGTPVAVMTPPPAQPPTPDEEQAWTAMRQEALRR